MEVLPVRRRRVDGRAGHPSSRAVAKRGEIRV